MTTSLPIPRLSYSLTPYSPTQWLLQLLIQLPYSVTPLITRLSYFSTPDSYIDCNSLTSCPILSDSPTPCPLLSGPPPPGPILNDPLLPVLYSY